MNTRNFLLATMLAGVAAFSGLAQAQQAETSNPGSTPGEEEGVSRGDRMSFLSETDRQHLMRVRREVMASDPQLKTEEENLRQERKAAEGSGSTLSKTDKQAFRQKQREHREQMAAAMLKADPTIQPVLDQIKAHRHAGAGSAAATDQAGGNP